MITIPTPPAARAGMTSTQRTKLDGKSYSLRFAYNTRTDSWSLDVLTAGSAKAEPIPIALGMAIHIGYNLLRFASHPQTPPGILMAVSSDGSRKAPGLNELGTRVRLFYVPEGESLAG